MRVKPLIITILGITMLLSACAIGNTVASSSEPVSIEASSEVPISSRTISSELASSEKPSELASSEKPSEIASSEKSSEASSQKSESSEVKAIKVPSPPNSTTSQMSDEETQRQVEKHIEEMRKENGKKINSSVVFIVTDTNGSFIEGVNTDFRTNYIPILTDSAAYVGHDSDLPTNGEGKTSVDLLKQDIDYSIEEVYLKWSKPFEAVVTMSDKTSYPIKSTKTNDGSYRASVKGLSILIVADATYTFNVAITEAVE